MSSEKEDNIINRYPTLSGNVGIIIINWKRLGKWRYIALPLLFVAGMALGILCGGKGEEVWGAAIVAFPFLILILLFMMEPFRRRKMGYGWKMCLFGDPVQVLEDRRRAKQLRRQRRFRKIFGNKSPEQVKRECAYWFGIGLGGGLGRGRD